MLLIGNLSADDVQAIAGSASAFLAAVAAAAAWATTRQGRHTIEAADRPLLEPQVLADPLSGMLGLSVINTGRGVARGARYVLHGGGLFAEGVLADGFIVPHQRVSVGSLVGPVDTSATRGDLPDLAAIVSYRDAEGFAHYRTHAGAAYTPKTLIRRRPKFPEVGRVWRKLFPDIDFEHARLVQSGMTTEWPPKPTSP
ncbi:hypothetical protein [Solirubrobacter soli]|uniref:hypothetical protein n=1 Tax=Solirubrobacter soli TaxID=363832 RepID=UPI0004892EFD|nr:hypothetical protein [Solirubrobacter soli]